MNSGIRLGHSGIDLSNPERAALVTGKLKAVGRRATFVARFLAGVISSLIAARSEESMKLTPGAKAMGLGVLAAVFGYLIHSFWSEQIGFGVIVLGWVVAFVGFLGHLSRRSETKRDTSD